MLPNLAPNMGAPASPTVTAATAAIAVIDHRGVAPASIPASTTT